MSNIIEKIKTIKGLNSTGKCSISDIMKAQKELDLTFPEEYVDYVREFGCIDFGGTEWTGLNIEGYLNTVTATKREKEDNAYFPKGCFVLEHLNIDAILIIVNEDGKVFHLQYDNIEPICDSISEYLDECIEREK